MCPDEIIQQTSTTKVAAGCSCSRSINPTARDTFLRRTHSQFLLPVSMHLNASQHCHFQIVVIQYDSVSIQFDFFLSLLQFFEHLLAFVPRWSWKKSGWQLSRWSNMPQRKQRPNRLDMVCFVLSRLTQDTIEDNFPLVRAQIRSYESPAWRQWSL